MKSPYVICIPIIDLRLRFIEEIDHGTSYNTVGMPEQAAANHK
ncbi:hypothetical protein [Paenibacillus sp. FSL W7-1332]